MTDTVATREPTTDGQAPILDAQHMQKYAYDDEGRPIRGTDVLLQRQRSMQRAIRLRNPYVDPMSLLQTDLLKRWRSAERPDDATLAALFASINGIAHALQNTG